MQSKLSRRDLVKSGTALFASAALPSAGASLASGQAKVIVAGGHPGDPEYGCGGTIARLGEAGAEVVLLYLNEGEPADAPARLPKGTRVAEAKKACALLKARPRFAGQIDGSAVVDREHYASFRKLIEAEKPRAVFTHWPIDNHADHRAITMLVYDAWLHMHRQFALFFYEVSNGEDTVQFAPNRYVNIDSAEPLKKSACLAHASQNPEKFYTLQDSVARWRGLESGHGRAEAFLHHAQSPAFDLPA